MASDARLVSSEGTTAALPPISWEEAGASSQVLTPELHDPSSNAMAFHGMLTSSHQDFIPLATTVSTASQPQCQAGDLTAGS